MGVLNNVACGDTYTPAATLQSEYNPQGGWFVVGAGAGVVAQLQYLIEHGAGRGTEEWAIDETQLGGGASGGLPTNAIGIRFKNAIPGQVATVTAYIGTGRDPVLSVTSFGGQSAAGAAVLGQGQTNGMSGSATALTGVSLPCQAVAVRANPGNSGKAYLGDGLVTAANGYELAANDAIGMDVSNPVAVFFTVDTTGDGVSWVAIG